MCSLSLNLEYLFLNREESMYVLHRYRMHAYQHCSDDSIVIVCVSLEHFYKTPFDPAHSKNVLGRL